MSLVENLCPREKREITEVQELSRDGYLFVVPEFLAGVLFLPFPPSFQSSVKQTAFTFGPSTHPQTFVEDPLLAMPCAA